MLPASLTEKSNSSFKAHIQHHKEELEQYYLSAADYEAHLCNINEAVCTIGVSVLKRTFPEQLDNFVDFCIDNADELHHVGVK